MKDKFFTQSRAILGRLVALIAVGSLGFQARAMEGDPYANETPAQRDARMAWWREAKFGMFIHWGVYAVPAGFDEDKPIGGIGEWIMLNGKIPVARYRAFAQNFNPVKYDPAAWVALAKSAGMRYMVLTAKHHDGFALFPSAASQWNIVDATPWKKDLIAPLAEAARAQGMKFGLYYSQAQDWTNPGGAKANFAEGQGWDDAQKGSFDSYIDTLAVPQVREILTRYQPDVLWWDTPYAMTPERAAKLAQLLSLRPGIIHNNRLGAGYKGDTETPEQVIPATGFPGRDWETCMTLNDTWGFKRDDHQWKPTPALIRNLVDIVSKGGNYLLNIGPNAQGEIPPESVQRLQEVGAWMKVNGESIYGNQASPFKKLAWGRSTVKPAGPNTILYLHVLDWPADGKLVVPGLANPIQSAELLAGGAKLAVTPSDQGPVLTLPATAPDAACTTIKLVVTGPPDIKALRIAADKDGVIRLRAVDASMEGAEARLENEDSEPNIGFWTNPKDAASWNLRAENAGKYLIQVEAATPDAGAVLLIQGIGKLAFPVPVTGDYKTYQTTKVGEVTLTQGAQVTLTLRPVVDGWHAVNIRKIELLPQP
jgi:alpha-L-fucosidase